MTECAPVDGCKNQKVMNHLDQAMPVEPPLPPRLYLVICNIQKLANVKALMKTAFAFGCQQVWVVGQSKNMYKNSNKKANPPVESEPSTDSSSWIPKQFQEAMSRGQIELLLFPRWNDLMNHLQKLQEQPESRKIALVGVEIDERSQVLDSFYAPLDKCDGGVNGGAETCYQDMAILMGNEGQGIHPKHLEACEGRLIRIPQYGVGTASFNVNVACSIALHHIDQWKRNQYKVVQDKSEFQA